MIQDFRNFSQSLFFKLMLGLICITFVFSFGVGSFFGERKEVLAKVNSEEILMRDYQRLYSQRVAALQQQLGNNAEQMIKQLNLEQATLRFLIDQKLIEQTAKEIGLRITDHELRTHITQQPGFQYNGSFDSEEYRDILKQNRLTTYEYETMMRQDLLYARYQELLRQGIVISDQEVEQAYKLENEKRNVQYVYFDPKKFEEEATYTDEELQAYYQKNVKQAYQSDEKYQISYFTLTLNNFRNPDLVKDREIERYYEKNQESYSTPGEVKARHILLKFNKDNDEERTQVQEKAQGLLAKLKAGADFIELAKEHSEDLSSSDGGDLGWFKTGEMVASVETAAFGLEPNELSEVVESPFGFHIIKVDDKKPEVIKPLAEVRAEIVSTLAERRAEKKLNLEFNRLPDRVKKEGLAAVAKSFDKELKTSKAFNLKGSIPGLGSARSLEPNIRHKRVGDTGQWKRNPVRGHVFFEVTSYQAAEDRPFDDVKNLVIQEVKKQKSVDLAKEASEKALELLKQGRSLESVAQLKDLEIQSLSITSQQQHMSDVGRNPHFKEVVYELSEENPYGHSWSQQKAYIIQYKGQSMEKHDDVEQKKDNIRTKLASNLQQHLLKQEVEMLRKSASIEILNPFFKLNYEQTL